MSHSANGNPASDATVSLIDDDSSVRQSLRMLLESVGLRVRAYGSAREFLQAYDAAICRIVARSSRMPRYEPRHGRERPVVAVLAYNPATEITDFVVPYGVLVESGVADVVAVATAMMTAIPSAQASSLLSGS